MTTDRGFLRARWSEPERWQTLRGDRRVLAITRTFTSAVRLLDALSVLRADPRVEVMFAVDDTSAFSSGVADLLRAAGVNPIALTDVAADSFDLALTASENVEFERINAPVMVLPHGIGFNRVVPDSRTQGERVSGVVPADRMDGRDVSLAISHPDQKEQLRADHPQAAARCVMIGDLAYDRLTASLPLRDHYRTALGARPEERLVVVTSTWDSGSLFQDRPELPARLLGELPVDEYRVALILHPNIWCWHSAYQVRLWLADALDAGLVLVPPAAGWQAALVAADVVVGDHGSVTMYGAALDRPVLLAGDASAARIVPGVPSGDLVRTAPRLRGDTPLRPQLDAVITAHRPGRYDALADRMFACRGAAASMLRAFLYGKLDLPEPVAPAATRSAEMPEPEVRSPRSYVIFSLLDGPEEVRLWRSPAVVPGAAAPDPRAIRHLSVGDDEPDRRLPGNASVIVRRVVADPAAADSWLAATFGCYPGVRVVGAAVAGGCLVGLRDGRRVQVITAAEPSVAAAMVYACLRAGRPAAGRMVVRLGGGTFTATLRPWSPA